MRSANIGVLILAVLVIAIVGAYALLYPGTTNGTLAIGSLLTLAGLIGATFFHQGSQAFLGDQLAAQRAITTQALMTKSNGSGASSTPSTSSSASPSATTTTPPSAGS